MLNTPEMSRLELIRWCATWDSNDMDVIGITGPCGVCGLPTKHYSVSFSHGSHLRCNVRLWEFLQGKAPRPELLIPVEVEFDLPF